MGVTDKLAYRVHKMSLLCALSVVIGFQIPYLDDATKCMITLFLATISKCACLWWCNPTWSGSTAINMKNVSTLSGYVICAH